MFLIYPTKTPMVGGRITIPTVFQVATPTELLTGTFSAFWCVRGAPVFTKTPLSWVVKIGTKIGVVIFTFYLPNQVCIITRITHIQTLVVLGR